MMAKHDAGVNLVKLLNTTATALKSALSLQGKC